MYTASAGYEHSPQRIENKHQHYLRTKEALALAKNAAINLPSSTDQS